MINIFVIPSWFPTKEDPNFGIFIKEQHISISDFNSETNQFISFWGNNSGEIKFLNFFKLLKILFKKIFNNYEIFNSNKNLHIIFRPIFYWTNKLPFGYEYMIKKSTEKNFLYVIKKYKKIDIIHAHVGYPAGYVAYYLSKKYKIPYIITEHMSPFPFKELIKNDRLKHELNLAYKYCKSIIAVSPSLKNDISKYGFNKIEVIPNFVDEDVFYPLNIKSDSKFIFVTICGINEQKGINILLHAIKEWSPENNIEFKIAGNGPLLDYYKNLAIELKINHLIKWIGSVSRDKVCELLNKSNVFVLPSNHETFGIVYVEALACGLPIIATKCGGPESIVNNSNGLLVEKNSPKKLNLAMQEIFNNYQFYDRDLIRNSFLENFSKKATISKLINLYKKNI